MGAPELSADAWANRPTAHTVAFAGSVKAVALLERVKLLSSLFQAKAIITTSANDLL
jgi:hypothetical protein